MTKGQRTEPIINKYYGHYIDYMAFLTKICTKMRKKFCSFYMIVIYMTSKRSLTKEALKSS